MRAAISRAVVTSIISPVNSTAPSRKRGYDPLQRAAATPARLDQVIHQAGRRRTPPFASGCVAWSRSSAVMTPGHVTLRLEKAQCIARTY